MTKYARCTIILAAETKEELDFIYYNLCTIPEAKNVSLEHHDTDEEALAKEVGEDKSDTGRYRKSGN